MDSTTNATNTSREDMDVENRTVARLYVRKAVYNIEDILDERKLYV
jgi:hypothetical protein